MAGNVKRQQCIGSMEPLSVRFRRSKIFSKEMVPGSFDLYGKRAFGEERALRQTIRQNFLECQQSHPKNQRPEFRTKNDGGLVTYSLDYDDGSWIQLTYDPTRILPKESKDEDKPSV